MKTIVALMLLQIVMARRSGFLMKNMSSGVHSSCKSWNCNKKTYVAVIVVVSAVLFALAVYVICTCSVMKQEKKKQLEKK